MDFDAFSTSSNGGSVGVPGTFTAHDMKLVGPPLDVD
jgi:hypothetical protein